MLILGLVLVLSGNCNSAIVYPKAPVGGRQIVVENVGRMLREHPDGTIVSTRALQIEDLTIAEPHRWYDVGAADLASGHLLSSARSGSWRYVLIHGTNAVGVAEIFNADTNIGDDLRFGALYQTAFCNETLEALRKAKEMPQIQKQDYELRLVRISAINFFAVWLHGKADEIILPLPPTFGRKLKAYQPYSESHIIKVLKPDANEVMKAPRSLR